MLSRNEMFGCVLGAPRVPRCCNCQGRHIQQLVSRRVISIIENSAPPPYIVGAPLLTPPFPGSHQIYTPLYKNLMLFFRLQTKSPNSAFNIS